MVMTLKLFLMFDSSHYKKLEGGPFIVNYLSITSFFTWGWEFSRSLGGGKKHNAANYGFFFSVLLSCFSSFFVL